MKKLSFYSLALAGLMLGACSNELDVDNTGTGVLPGEKGYISLSLNLPTQPSSRANDNFDQGDEAEYKVNDATLLLFVGTSEATATFASAYPLNDLNFSGATTGNITTSSDFVQMITKPSLAANEKIYALVVLNRAGLISESNNVWKYGEEEFKSGNEGTTFKTFAESVHKLSLEEIAKVGTNPEDGNFLMLNAPLYSKPGSTNNPLEGGAGTVATLTVIDKNNIFTTATEAKKNPAARIFVERAVAKVTVKAAEENLIPTENPNKFVSINLEGWTLDITNLKTFPVRKVDDSWWGYTSDGSDGSDASTWTSDYRFVGASAVAKDLFRTYWGIDPNYDGFGYVADGNVTDAELQDNFKVLSGTAPIGQDLTAIGSNAYCMENTFNVENMRKDQTTRVIVAAQLAFDTPEEYKDFYVLNNAKGTIYSAENIVKIIKQAYLQNNTINELIKANLVDGSSIVENDVVVEFESDEDILPENQMNGLNGGIIKVAAVYINDEVAASKFKDQEVPAGLKKSDDDSNESKKVAAELNEHYKVSYYKNGVAYYPVMIKHFGDDQTPWKADGKSVSYPVGVQNENWLGRYGVLRNNWYEINVTGIRNIGSAEVEPEYGYDDPLESWISVEINILSWAKRSQSVEL